MCESKVYRVFRYYKYCSKDIKGNVIRERCTCVCVCVRARKVDKCVYVSRCHRCCSKDTRRNLGEKRVYEREKKIRSVHMSLVAISADIPLANGYDTEELYTL